MTTIENVGIGALRKMGFGYGKIISWELIETAVACVN